MPSTDISTCHARIRRVQTSSPIEWLRRGWSDLRGNPAASLSYGVAIAALGYLILVYLAGKPYLVTAAVSGFLLVGPVAAAGLYELSRRQDQGQRIGLLDSLRGLGRRAGSLFYYGLFLAFVLLSWERLSAVLFALFYQGDFGSIEQLFSGVVLSADYLGFTLNNLLVGGLLAALVYTLSAVSIPMLLDRDTDIVTAMMTSAGAVATNPRPMLRWAGLIALLMAVGFATLMIGMIVVLPWLGHASWHAYRDLVERSVERAGRRRRPAQRKTWAGYGKGRCALGTDNRARSIGAAPPDVVIIYASTMTKPCAERGVP